VPRPTDAMEFPMALGWSAILAADVLETFRLGQPYLSAVRKIAQECGLPPDLRHADSAPDLQSADGPTAPPYDEG